MAKRKQEQDYYYDDETYENSEYDENMGCYPQEKRSWLKDIIKWLSIVIVIVLGVGVLTTTITNKINDDSKKGFIKKTPSKPQTSQKETKPVENPAFTYYMFPYKAGENGVGQQSIQVCIQIVNTGNTNLELGSAQIDVEGTNGDIVAIGNYVRGYPQILEPGDAGYYYAEISCKGIDISQELIIVPHLNVKKTSTNPIRFDTSNITFNDDIRRINVLGKVSNNTNKNFNTCIVAIFMFDKEDNILGVAETVESYNAGETKGFSAEYYSYFGETTSDVYSYITIAYPYQY